MPQDRIRIETKHSGTSKEDQAVSIVTVPISTYHMGILRSYRKDHVQDGQPIWIGFSLIRTAEISIILLGESSFPNDGK